MKVDIRIEDHDTTLMFTVLFFPAIHIWLQENGIECKVENIRAFEWFEEPSASCYAGISGEVVYKGRRYTFTNEFDAIHFKLRWAVTKIDEQDEAVQRYLTTLRKGVNQSVARQQDDSY